MRWRVTTAKGPGGYVQSMVFPSSVGTESPVVVRYAFDAGPDVRCVTGMIAPLELDTRTQQLIEAHAGFNKGFEQRLFDPAGDHHDDVLFPFAAGVFGSGANMSFDTEYLRSVGGFDAAMGAGTVALGGDDLAAFYDVMATGHQLVYEPAAIVAHRHHRELPALQRQAYGYRDHEFFRLKIFAIHDARSSDQLASMHDVLIEAFAHIDKRMEQGGATGVPSGFADMDSMTGGLHESELVILAARPSMGKTALATNIADHVAVEAQGCVLFVSLEMARLELAQRMLCARGEINGKKFRGNYLSGEDRDRLLEASAKLSKAPLYIDDTPSRTVTEIAAAARRLKRRQNLALIVIDYLQLIEPDNPKDPRQEQVAKIARRLKGLARELSVPLLCLAQLNRQAEATKDNRPRLSHLRESGAIEQDADVVMFVHREEYYMSREESRERDLVGKAELIVAKQRNGPTDDVKLTWRQEFTRFENRAVDRYDEFNDFQGTAEPF